MVAARWSDNEEDGRHVVISVVVIVGVGAGVKERNSKDHQNHCLEGERRRKTKLQTVLKVCT